MEKRMKLEIEQFYLAPLKAQIADLEDRVKKLEGGKKKKSSKKSE